jgi:hypothetical protein
VATALPTIVGDLGRDSSLSWVVTAYLLASTVGVYAAVLVVVAFVLAWALPERPLRPTGPGDGAGR